MTENTNTSNFHSPKGISFKHSGNAGDIIYSLAGIKAACERYETKADIYLWLDRKGFYYEGAVHPLGGVMLNKYMYSRLKPLLESQSYISSVNKFKGEKIQIDLNLIRQRDIGMPNGSITQWYPYVFPDMAHDASIPWISVGKDAKFKDSIIINRTQRYQNPHISYAFLRGKGALFVGTKDEYQLVKQEVKDLTHIDFANFYDLAVAINSCKFFIGNQSMCFGLAEAMKAPRILEVCNFAHNVIPTGPGPAFEYFSQNAFEWYVDELDGKHEQEKAKTKDVLDINNTPDLKGLKFDSPTITMRAVDTDKEIDKPEPALKLMNEPWWNDVAKNTLVDIDRLLRIADWTASTEKLKGCVAEVGVYKGGSALLISKFKGDRPLYLFDTFEGMPEVSEFDLHHKGDFADTSVKSVVHLLSHEINCNIYKGKFPERVRGSFIEDMKFSLAHIDVDIYQSVKDCLEFFWPRLLQGGVLIIDDYNEPNCPGAKKAVDEFFGRRLRNHDVLIVSDTYSQRIIQKI